MRYLFLTLLLLGCSDKPNPVWVGPDSGDADADTDVDADSDSDTDMDVDTDTDTDTETDTESESETSTETETETDTETDTDTDTVDTDTDPYNCDGGRLDPATNLCWQYPSPSGLYNRQTAVDYCAGLNLGGHTDWHLPVRDNFVELLGDCDSSVTGGWVGYCDSCADSTTCSTLFGVDVEYYWSSSITGGEGWYAYFQNGRLNFETLVTTYHVRCVREDT